MKHTAERFTRGARLEGVTLSAASGLGVLSTRRGALLVDEGEWVVRVAGSEPFVLTDAEYRASFGAPMRARPAPKRERTVHVDTVVHGASPRALRALKPVPAPAPGEITRPRSTVASHAATAAYDGTDG